MTPNKIICGSALEVLKDMPDESINCSISSPPYWGLRAYNTEPQIWGGEQGCEHRWGLVQGRKMGGGTHGIAPEYNEERKFDAKSQFCSLCGAWRGELGLEPTIELYIDHLCTIYDEVWRILRKDGTVWINLGDTYGTHTSKRSGQFGIHGLREREKVFAEKRPNVGLEKSLCLIPDRFRIAMVERGWIIRNRINWVKPNPMPSSAKDRFTVDFEDVIFMVKSKRYFFEPQYEPYLTESNAERPRMGQGTQTKYNQKRGYGGGGSSFQGHSGTLKADGTQIQSNPLGRNKRTTWTIPTEAFPEAHFATFPRKLVEPMIKAGCPRYVCTKCGTPRRKVYDRQIPPEDVMTKNKQTDDKLVKTSANRYGKGQGQKLQNWLNEHPPTFKGYSSCGCENPTYKPGIVLDMFGGSCTTGEVAYEHGRDYVMVELSPEYAKMGEKRITKKTEQYSLIERS